MLHASTPLKHRALALACGSVLLAGVLAGCGSSSTTAPTTTVAGADTTAAADPPATTNAPATPASIVGGAATISVTVGTDDFDTSKGTRVVSVPKGTAVTIELTDAAIDEQYHLHGFDVEATAKKGEKATISVTADTAGQFDLESHTTTKTLLVLLVTN